MKVQNKEDNKNLALGTSKINYMDPRITISWCKAKEVPIEKIFPKTLRSKFSWAMSNEPHWKF
jgi:DNA topoisomerase-1